MNKRQKEVLQHQLLTEQSAIDGLREAYKTALDDIEAKIAYLNARTDSENMASIVYQKQYQEALKRQVSGVLDTLQGEQFDTIGDFLVDSYSNGYVGAMYDVDGQGIPIISPIDQEQVVKAITTDSKLSKPLYNSLGEDVDGLKSAIQKEVSTGIIRGASYGEIAKRIEKRMVGDYKRFNGGAYAKAARIARTEGHRVQNTAAYDAQKAAQSKGANIVKQWDATLDARTRDSHAKVDGELTAVDEKFSNGLLFPGDPHGAAAEVCNCRCALLQRAKWALDADELERLKQRAEYYGLDKADSFEEFKQKYLDTIQQIPYNVEQNKQRFNTIEDPMREVTGRGIDSNPEEISKILDDLVSAGAEVIYRDNAAAYCPSGVRGQAGQFIIDSDSSFSAWSHEYKHFCDDRSDGYIGFRVFENPEKCKQREIDAYQIEIEMAQGLNRPDIAGRLQELLAKELKHYD
ncbi:MAG TPA: hypothetical protein DDY98_02355 [Ruminococcaceae bacterium]|nr:hypothetical protein [Oscillospiraceae bacterium]